VSNLILPRLSEQQFIHGGCDINGNLATILDFELNPHRCPSGQGFFGSGLRGPRFFQMYSGGRLSVRVQKLPTTRSFRLLP
jgi:hypothetical protein